MSAELQGRLLVIHYRETRPQLFEATGAYFPVSRSAKDCWRGCTACLNDEPITVAQQVRENAE